MIEPHAIIAGALSHALTDINPYVKQIKGDLLADVTALVGRMAEIAGYLEIESAKTIAKSVTEEKETKPRTESLEEFSPE